MPARSDNAFSRRSLLVLAGLGGLCALTGRLLPATSGAGMGGVALSAAAGAADYPGEDALTVGLCKPQGLCSGPDGSLYVADTDHHRIRQRGLDGLMRTVVGSGLHGYAGDGDLAVYAELQRCGGVALAPDGGLYIADTGNHCLRRVDPAGIISTVAGMGQPGYAGDGGLAPAAALQWPAAVAVAPDGAVYIADTFNHVIRRLEPSGMIMTVAGTGERGFAGDGGPGVAAQLSFPTGLAVGPDGAVVIADRGNSRVRRLDPDGSMTTVAGKDWQRESGVGELATETDLAWPCGVAVQADGALLIADTGHHRIWRVDPDGRIGLVAGSGRRGDGGDGDVAVAAALDNPWSVAEAPDGTVVIGDWGNHRVRAVGMDGVINTIVGTGQVEPEDGATPPVPRDR